MNKRLLYLITLFAFLLTGCPQTDEESIIEPTKEYYQKIELKNDTNEEVFGMLLLTNYSNTNSEVPFVTVNNSTKISRSISSASNRNRNIIPNRLEMPKLSYNRKITSRSTSIVETDYKKYNIGDKYPFWLIYSNDQNNYQRDFILQSREFIESDIELFIWVDNKDTNYSSEAIPHLNTTFKEIYLEMTTIYGKHWGIHNGKRDNENLISEENKDIHILLTDIDDDKNSSPKGFVNGYFHGYKDSFMLSKHPFQNNINVSNQNNNIVIDSYQYFHKTQEGEPVKEWSNNSYETAATITTIIHEFQHMLHFYNKDIKYDIYSDTFINEMFSMVAEDIFANKYSKYYNNYTKINTTLSPDIIRIPEFNFFWDMQSSFNWDYSQLNLNSYSMSYVVGAYLIRNYGLELFLNYFETKQTGKDGILYSLNQIAPEEGNHNTQTLLKNMGTAILLSNNQISDKGLMFNKSENFKINGYSLKPINFFNNKEYFYYSLGTEQNRLYNYDYNKGYYQAPLSFVTAEDLKRLNNTPEEEFLKESNIYVNLGKIEKGAKIIIYTFAPNIDYQELYFTIN